MSYERELVERLLPAVWDPGMVVVENPTAPDPDMPRTKSNPKTANTIYAMLADIRRAWRHAPATLAERQAMLLRYGMGMSKTETGHILGIGRKAASQRLDLGVGRLADYLNGYADTSV
ncbi:DNA-directed RNA polymerase specialized sigma24 family protein [Actinoplanes campanulatus]|uniref:DNA-directed RNA polymerase specialized sigma24 family protein n=1 Tax=Actinoplanes campanulatus TaxID=113559 RepID=A0A7W5FI85_9ACTN|nr:hypothetical protein [Actinoplanes campanulatus]MBB3099431.1 DNA-directed RNA polymerase specialized sigma24 family protein [Actinoplanes campanulatus]GGN40028.1 hypothetical protein GCM10010109_68540 [Actinoplanes campanulatus]GID42359.1 hypothetical protein Aca09nite_88650 [Actinoplanes campanulatus]